MKYPFAAYHPIINFAFFIGAIVFGMFFRHPVFLCVGLTAAVMYYLILTGREGGRFFIGMVCFYVVITLINPFFNRRGDTVLFTYFGGRTFTLEALIYGLVTATMFVTIMFWFACYNRIMSNDKFVSMFARLIPQLSLLLSMVFRLVPNFKRRAQTIAGARKCIGKAPFGGGRKARFRNSLDILSTLTSWALEGGAQTADSMRSRGYGSTKRSHFDVYRMSGRDFACAAVLVLGAAITIFCAARGGAHAEYIPNIVLGGARHFTILGAAGYAVFLFLPSAIHIWEGALWRILRSGI